MEEWHAKYVNISHCSAEYTEWIRGEYVVPSVDMDK